MTKMYICDIIHLYKEEQTMNATISMDALYDFLKSLSLGSENERWLAERLLNDAEMQSQGAPCQYTVEEMRRHLHQVGKRIQQGDLGISDEEVEKELLQEMPWLR